MDFVELKQLQSNYEFIEVKGPGHPDSLADALANALSRGYSLDTLKKFGAVLHHNIDKMMLLGGASYVSFGEGYLTKPIRVLLNGRFSNRFGDEEIDLERILYPIVERFFEARFGSLISPDMLELINQISTSSSPGNVIQSSQEMSIRHRWFNPRSLDDLPELRRHGANDTTIGVGYAPLTRLEKATKDILSFLGDSNLEWLGTDIKVMATRIGKDIDITICIPQIANFVQTLQEYRSNLESTKNELLSFLKNRYSMNECTLHLNTRDDYNRVELYLTATGSSIESGDEGVVGRGNRVNGLISSNRPYSMEGVAGKNPVYHAGKIYNILADKIARLIHEKINGQVEVMIVSQSGRALGNPWKLLVAMENIQYKIEIEKIVNRELDDMKSITTQFLNGEIEC